MSELLAQHEAHKKRRAEWARKAVPDSGIQLRGGYAVSSRTVEFRPRRIDLPAPVEVPPEHRGPVRVAVKVPQIDEIFLTVVRRELRVGDIQKAIIDTFGVSIFDFFSKRKTADVVLPRQIAMALVKRLTTKSMPDIGRRFGGRDHTTVLHAVRKIEPLIEAVADQIADPQDALEWAKALKGHIESTQKAKTRVTKNIDERRADARQYYYANRPVRRLARSLRVTDAEARKIIAEKAQPVEPGAEA